MSYVFEGAWYDFENDRELTLTPTILANNIHSWLHLLHKDSRLTYNPGITANELFLANQETFEYICRAFQRRRHCQIGQGEIRSGIEMFIKTVNS